MTPASYASFWSSFRETFFYQNLIVKSSTDNRVSIFYFNLIESIASAKSGMPELEIIQNLINSLYLILSPNEEEKLQFEDMFNRSQMCILYTLPDESYLTSHRFDLDTQKIVEI